jgi:hypothetical protein
MDMRFGGFAGRARLMGAAISLVSVGAPLTAAATASAASLHVTRACYVDTVSHKTVHRPNMALGGSGYVPGDTITFTSSDGSVDGQTRANDRGEFIAVIPAPAPLINFSKPTSKTVTLHAQDFSASGTITGTATVKSAYLDVATVPAKAKPHRRVTWYFSGFTPGHLIWGHFLRGKHQVARVRFGRAKGVCGLLRVHRTLLPSHLSNRKYGVQLDNSKRYSRRAKPRIDTTLNVFHT